MALPSSFGEVVWARKLAVELGFPQLKATNIYEDNTGLYCLGKQHAFTCAQQTCCSACVLHSVNHSRQNHLC